MKLRKRAGGGYTFVVFVVTSSSRHDDRRMTYNHRIAVYVVKGDMACYQSVGKRVADYLPTMDFPS